MYVLPHFNWGILRATCSGQTYFPYCEGPLAPPHYVVSNQSNFHMCCLRSLPSQHAFKYFIVHSSKTSFAGHVIFMFWATLFDFTTRLLVPVDIVLVVCWILEAFNDAFQMQKLGPFRSWEYCEWWRSRDYFKALPHRAPGGTTQTREPQRLANLRAEIQTRYFP